MELADALRLRNMMDRLGIDEESTTEFLSETYNKCMEIGIQPHQIAKYLGDLVAFSRTNSRNIEKRQTKTSGLTGSLTAGGRGEGEEEEEIEKEQGREVEREELEEEQERYGTNQILFFSQLPEYMAYLREEKIKLQDDIRELRIKNNFVENQYTLLKHNKDELLKRHNMVEEQLKWYEEIKTELRKFGLRVDVIPKFVKSVRWIEEAGYPVEVLTANFSNYKELEQSSQTLELENSQKEKRSIKLDQRITFLEELAQMHSLKKKEIDAIQEMGFGYKELKCLRHIVKEIAEANKINNNIVIVDNSPEAANNHTVYKFLGDIEADYDVLGFKQTRVQLENQIQNLTLLHKQQQQAISAILRIRASLVSLFQKGITEDQVLNLMDHLNKYPNTIESISKANFEGLPSQSSSSTQLKESKSENGPSNSSENIYSGFMMSLATEPKWIIQDSNSLEVTLPIATVSANGYEGTNIPNNVTDGNFDTYWFNKKRGSWLLLDLGAIKNIQRIKIAWYQGNNFDYYYEILLSDDAMNFKSIKRSCSGGGYRPSIMEYNLEQGSQGRYIKIVVRGNNFDDNAGISEVSVTGSY